MRRIARPQRSIALPSSSSHLLRPQTSRFPCQFALAPCNSAAPFSTTPHPGFLLSDKQDKKKHQAFVRRWQKRLLGDSEPIGAHVDPYDGTSPVRISPEEYGEEEEVLVDDDGNAVTKDQSLEILYRKAESGHGLRVVGGKDLQRETEEEKMAVEYEMLTGKTYTPLTLRMANEIEDLTGTPYSLLGENLMMAQVWQEETGKPYTEFSFGRVTQIKDLKQLRRHFQQAIVEVYTLKQAELDMDLTKLSNRGIYNPPHWISEVKMYKSPSGELALIYPGGRTTEKLLLKMQDVPAWDPAKVWAETEQSLSDEAEDMEYEQIEQAAQPGNTEPPKVALAKVDEDKRFDFMSNRPVPRAKPIAPKVEETIEKLGAVKAEADAEIANPHSAASLIAAVQASEAAVSAIRHNVLEHRVDSVEKNISTIRHNVLKHRVDSVEKNLSTIRQALNEAAAKSAELKAAAMREVVREEIEASVSESITTITPNTTTKEITIKDTIAPEAKWRHASLDDISVKFALIKRLTQLTGIRISDPTLTTIHTLGDLYGALCASSKPKPKKLFDMIRVESQKAAKPRSQTQPEAIVDLTRPQKKKPTIAELLTIPNVHVLPKRIKSFHKHKQVGLDKVINFALQERELESERRAKWPYKNAHVPKGSAKVLSFGEPISPKVVRELEREREAKEKVSRERREEWLRSS